MHEKYVKKYKVEFPRNYLKTKVMFKYDLI